MIRYLKNALYALALSTISLSCTSRPPLSRLERIIEQHHPHLAETARRGYHADIEHGGIIIALPDGTTEYVEIENVVLRDRERFDRYCRGAHEEYETLAEHIATAARVRSVCAPGLKDHFTATAAKLITGLPTLPLIPPGPGAELFWKEYNALVMHQLYTPCARSMNRALARGERLMNVHTHEGKALCPPSQQDLDNSHHYDNLIVAIDETNAIVYFLAREGETVLISRKEPLLARAD